MIFVCIYFINWTERSTCGAGGDGLQKHSKHFFLLTGKKESISEGATRAEPATTWKQHVSPDGDQTQMMIARVPEQKSQKSNHTGSCWWLKK